MWQSARWLVLIATLLQGLAGCRALRPINHGGAADSRRLQLCSLRQTAQSALADGKSLEAAGNEDCVDAYFRACESAWADLTGAELAPPRQSALQTYNSALARLLAAGQRFGRLDASCALVVRNNGQTIRVPTAHHGFAWQPQDFQRLHPPPTGREPLLHRRYGCSGVGVPLVVERSRDSADPFEARFFLEQSYFVATAILRFVPAESPDDGPADGSALPVLDFYNALPGATIDVGGNDLPLAADLSAGLAKTVEVAPRTYFAGFITPGGAPATARLGLLEPYQPGKSPVVLIHGLFSDPQSWADLINDLRAVPGFSERYQIWVFRYPTGQGFLQSATVLRRELQAALQSLDPNERDPALQQTVLIGHSMGGLIAKLQVAHSEELVWSRLANRPLDQIATTPATRAFLAENCYFDPLESVCRVIFIASPHCGSLPASELVGKFAAKLVEPSPEQAAMHAQLMRDNPGVFNPLVQRRFPTSLDMLTPSSPLLDIMKQMRLRPGVKLHNIVGVSHPASLDGPSDGVVSVHSARHPDCESEFAVGAAHAVAHRSLQGSHEILRILGCHSAAQHATIP